MKQMTFRARQKKLKREERRKAWTRLMKNPTPINITEVWNLNDYTAKYVAPRLKMLKKIITEKEVAPGVLADGFEPNGLKPLAL